MRSEKEHAYRLGQTLQRTQTGEHKLPQIGSRPQDGFPRSMMLDVVPDLLVGIEFGRVRRQKEQLQLSLLPGDVLSHRAATMNCMAIENQEYGMRGIMHIV